MSLAIDHELLAERAAVVDRHLRRMLAGAKVIPHELAQRLGHAGFRNLLVHAYAELDLRRVPAAATSGPADLRAFLAALRDHTG